MRWFRFYTEALDDPKVQRLDPATFKHWVNLLCVSARNDGYLPSHEDLAFALRIDEIAVGSLLDRLLIAGLIDVVKGGPNGSRIAPHGWHKRQYKSDTSTDRVKRYRQRSKDDTVTPPETETDTETEVITPKGVCASRDAPAFTISDFQESWNAVATECGLTQIRKLTPARQRAFRVRQREYPDIADWQSAFRCLRTSKWMHGDNKSGWRADPDFFLQAKSFTKLVEGSYAQAD